MSLAKYLPLTAGRRFSLAAANFSEPPWQSGFPIAQTHRALIWYSQVPAYRGGVRGSRHCRGSSA
jgi:hypothetical protein